MSELEDKLNSLLSDPAGMAQVVQLAQQLSGAMGSGPQAAAQPPPEPESKPLRDLPGPYWAASTPRPSPVFCRCCRRFPPTRAIPCSF